ncbi:MAG TPA: hypothetical protein VEU08_13940 [Vicinamibacterales bacterium]|nr:hypothetical protein [Vicinamibacterales bacterium]
MRTSTNANDVCSQNSGAVDVNPGEQGNDLRNRAQARFEVRVTIT